MAKDWERSAQAWVDFVDQGDPNREFLLDDVALRLIGNPQGLSIVDIGCGEGRFCRKLLALGASVTGVDPVEDLIETARARDKSGGYSVGSGTRLPLRDAQFDVAILYLVLIDIKDFEQAILETKRVLKPGGRVLVVNLNGFATTQAPAWLRNEVGEPQHVAVDNYFVIKGEMLQWKGIQVVNWHRPLQDYFQAFLRAGLVLEWFEEARPTSEQVQSCPQIALHERVPLFNAHVWRKPD